MKLKINHYCIHILPVIKKYLYPFSHVEKEYVDVTQEEIKKGALKVNNTHINVNL